MIGKRIMAVDLGERYVGIAVTDPLGITAQGLPTLDVKSEEETLEKLEILCKSNNVGKIVLGYPVNMNGTEGHRTEWVKQFGKKLIEKVGMPVLYRDERMTSQQALKTLHLLGKETRGNKDRINEISAVLILQSFLEERDNIEEDSM